MEIPECRENYVRQQRQTKRMVMNAIAECERSMIHTLREKGLEGGHEWYSFLRRNRMRNSENAECLKVNDEIIPDKMKLKESVKAF